MRGKRAKWIRKQLMGMNPYVLDTVNRELGEAAMKMQPRTIYRNLKRFWSEKREGVEKWKNGEKLLMKNMESSNVQNAAVSEENTTPKVTR